VAAQVVVYKNTTALQRQNPGCGGQWKSILRVLQGAAYFIKNRSY
jgi:hypothetical protein